MASHNPMQAYHGKSPDGGLFGAVFVKDGKILGEGSMEYCTIRRRSNKTWREMNAIRQAVCNSYGLKDFEGATLYHVQCVLVQFIGEV